jgi:hypothetical protein
MDQGGGRLSAWLRAAGAPEAMAGQITAALGPNGAELIARDPWSVLEVPALDAFPGAPQAADALARAVAAEQDPAPGPDPGDPRRTRALCGWLLRRAARAGSTVQGADVVAEALGGLGVSDRTAAVADAIEHGVLLAFADRVSLAQDAPDEEAEDFEAMDAEDDDDPAAMLTSARTLLALETWAFAEQSAAEAVQRLLATPAPLDPPKQVDLEPPAAGGPAVSAQDVERLVSAVGASGLTLALGATPQLLGAVAQAYPGALVACPGAAGLRTLAEAGVHAVDARELVRDPERIAEAQVLVIADAHLLGLGAAVVVLEAAAEGAHVLLAGDPAQPAAGPGQLLRDLLAIDDPQFGGAVPRVEFKRRPTGPLTALVDAVRHGGLPPRELLAGPDGASKEVVILPVREDAEAVFRAVQLVADSIPRTFGLTGTQVQVIAARDGGTAGAGALNAALKARLNPGPGVCAGFDPGDRVVFEPEQGPEDGGGAAGDDTAGGEPPADQASTTGAARSARRYGGETGTVVHADAQGLTVRFDAPHQAEGDEPVAFDPRAARRALRPAWALPGRTAQAGRWPAVVAVFDAESAAALTRASILAGMSAAGVHLSVVHGAGPALAAAVEQIPDRPRHTRLPFALEG